MEKFFGNYFDGLGLWTYSGLACFLKDRAIVNFKIEDEGERMRVFIYTDRPLTDAEFIFIEEHRMIGHQFNYRILPRAGQ